ncbi:acetyl-CoA acetyltransferase [Formosimonas limnophila]|uniref:acetyl-CoA C-acyltransferase n=1 Tax=Formosimonas limnophila TaxID=1384487 RepID=A0A8J3G061_9BURK|nr:acetyl-CoA C-acyltransferase [Formosimonas limnophila]GHA69768.1 acetyl-CoA acetyltransferase [Formosimonas limnophila]
MTQLQEAYIVAATRTPVGKAPRGVFKNTRPDDLLAHVLRSAVAQVPNLDPALIEDAIIGCAIPQGPQGLNMARMGVLFAGLPNTIGGVTVNRYCASGVTALAMAADRIRTGQADVMIAGGAESMSMVPMNAILTDMNPEIFTKDENVGIAYGMGLTAENVAKQWNISREAQDAFAAESHRRALAAQAAGYFNAEITPYNVTDIGLNLSTHELKNKNFTVSQDEGPRSDTTAEGLGKLKPVFAAKGSVTAGNSSQMSDGAGALILVSERMLKEHNLAPLGRFVSFSVRGVPPEIMGIGPKFAIPTALKVAGLQLSDIDWIELNEAFAAQALAVIQDLDMDMSKINPLGGAIALGHPLGATGAIRAATVLHGLKRTGGRYGMVTMCVGTGMGAAGIIERL